jgi:uncharacterized membrane protein YcgQ (UPF0703/DUF1980 family)
METKTLKNNSQTLQKSENQKRQLVLNAQSVRTIPTPADPYSY